MDIEGFSFPSGMLHRAISIVSVEDPSNYYTYHFYTTSPEHDISKLTPSQKKTIDFQRKLHGLNVEYRAQPETQMTSWVEHQELPFIMKRIKSIAKFIYFKGGQIEKNLCVAFDIPHMDLESLGCPKAIDIGCHCSDHQQFKNHCSLCEVISYREWLINQSISVRYQYTSHKINGKIVKSNSNWFFE